MSCHPKLGWAGFSRREFLERVAAGTAFLTGAGLLPVLQGADAEAPAEWPMLRREPARTGFVKAKLRPPFRLVWAREIPGERLGTAMEPIIASQKLFVATHGGSVCALSADTGNGLWRFRAEGPFLHSPAVAANRVMAASADGCLYALEANTGQLAWHFVGGTGGFSASPLLLDGAGFLGTRAGDFLAFELEQGKLLWRRSLGVPIRQTAAAADGKIFVTAEDLQVRCFRARDGALEWTSKPLAGQTARDYFPMLAGQGQRRYVVVRTNPVLNMGQRIERDRTLLCRNAEVDDSSWQKLDAWMKSDKARGTPELWAREQSAIVQSLEADAEARSFFVLDAATGEEAFVAPILWIAGCQGVGVQPTLTGDGRLLVFQRSAYGNWNLGVAPLVALGLLDLERHTVAPLFHKQGPQPPWNCFWGTADESQNFVVAGKTVLIIHQGTLSGFDLQTNELFPIAGERDTYGGFPNPPWARNEWHGPARGGVAIVGQRIYWQTGSRILCIASGEAQSASGSIQPAAIATDIPTATAQSRAGVSPARSGASEAVSTRNSLRQALTVTIEAILSQRWAPLFTDPGLAGRVFAFDHSGELFEALAWAFPHLPAELQRRAKDLLRQEWAQHPPFMREGWYSLKEGARREWFQVPLDYCARLGGDRLPHPFGNVSPIWRYAQRCAEETFVLEHWPKLKARLDEFLKSGWRLDPAKSDPFANRYLASLLACRRLAEKAGDSASAHDAEAKATETGDALVTWWKRAAEHGTLKTFHKASELDPFIGKGDSIFLAIAPHRHKLALFEDLTPEVAALVRRGALEAIHAVWQTFVGLCPTWWCLGEERQVHFGENFVDPPDFALSAFRALAWLSNAPADELARKVDLPFCRADLYHLIKLSLALEQR